MRRTWRVVACVSEPEHARVIALAKARDITVSRLICRAINSLLLDEGDDTELLNDCGLPGPKPKKKAQEIDDGTDDEW